MEYDRDDAEDENDEDESREVVHIDFEDEAECLTNDVAVSDASDPNSDVMRDERYDAEEENDEDDSREVVPINFVDEAECFF